MINPHPKRHCYVVYELMYGHGTLVMKSTENDFIDVVMTEKGIKCLLNDLEKQHKSETSESHVHITILNIIPLDED